MTTIISYPGGMLFFDDEPRYRAPAPNPSEVVRVPCCQCGKTFLEKDMIPQEIPFTWRCCSCDAANYRQAHNISLEEWYGPETTALLR